MMLRDSWAHHEMRRSSSLAVGFTRPAVRAWRANCLLCPFSLLGSICSFIVHKPFWLFLRLRGAVVNVSLCPYQSLESAMAKTACVGQHLASISSLPLLPFFFSLPLLQLARVLVLPVVAKQGILHPPPISPSSALSLLPCESQAGPEKHTRPGF